MINVTENFIITLVRIFLFDLVKKVSHEIKSLTTNLISLRNSCTKNSPQYYHKIAQGY